MDGVLADSEPLYFVAINTLLGRYGGSINHEQHNSIMAYGPREGAARVIEAAGVGSRLSVDTYLEDFDDVILSLLATMTEPIRGARALIDTLRERGVPLGLASSSKVPWIETTLRAIGLDAAFEVRVSGTQVPNGKPAPDVYLRAAELLGIAPEDCIGIEDTPPGLNAVKAAGMLAVQVMSSSTPFPPQPHADIALQSLEDFDLGLVAAD
jgi:HAD superfamily hydrolase (TIGR01509 family)